MHKININHIHELSDVLNNLIEENLFEVESDKIVNINTGYILNPKYIKILLDLNNISDKYFVKF